MQDIKSEIRQCLERQTQTNWGKKQSQIEETQTLGDKSIEKVFLEKKIKPPQ